MFGLPDVLEFLHSRHVEEGSTIRVLRHCRDSVIIAAEDVRLVLGMKSQSGSKYRPDN